MASKKNVPVQVAEAELPAVSDAIMRDLEQFSGAGLSTKSEDNLIPMVSLLQDLSPQVKERSTDYVVGARPGDFYIKALGILIPGSPGFLFQPCHFHTAVVEYVPRDKGGGYVTSYPVMPDDAVEVVNDKGKKVRQAPNGNELIDTRYHCGFLEHEGARVAVVLAFTSTGHSVSRQWMSQMNNLRIPGHSARPPSFMLKYRLSSKIRQKNNQEWFQFSTAFDRFLMSADDKEQYEEGKALYLSMEQGEKKVDTSSATAESDEEAPF